MQAFTQYTPTEIVFGKDSERETGRLVKKHGGTKAALVYGRSSVKASGLLLRIEDSLKAEGITHVEIGGAMPNPHLSFAREGAKTAADFGADFILAVGGGSAIDAAKAIAHGTKNPETDIWKFWLREVPLTKSLPVGVVLTISAAGSETSNSAVLTNTEINQKRGLNTDLNRPAFAIMNPELTYSLPKNQIASGVADIMMHTLDRYFAPENNENKASELTDEIAEALLRVVISNGPKLLDNPSDYQAASEIMWAGSLSHNGLTGLGRTLDFSVHQLGHELGGRFDVTHGESLTTMWAAWARYVQGTNPGRFAECARKVWGEQSAKSGIDKTVDFFKKINMPTCFTELGIGMQTDEMLHEMAHSTTHFGKRHIGTFRQLYEEDIYFIFSAANE